MIRRAFALGLMIGVVIGLWSRRHDVARANKARQSSVALQGIIDKYPPLDVELIDAERRLKGSSHVQSA